MVKRSLLLVFFTRMLPPVSLNCIGDFFKSNNINILGVGSCISELQLKVNCSKKFGLLAEPAQIFFYYNSLSAAIYLYMIRGHSTTYIC